MLTKKVLNKIFSQLEGEEFGVVYWDGEEQSFNKDNSSNFNPAFTIYINEKLSLNQIRKNPQLEIGEAYMRGDIDFDGSYKKLIKTAAENGAKLKNEAENLGTYSDWKVQKEAAVEEQAEGVQKHYDLGNDFFSLWQDNTMTYSCAYFKSKDDSLKKAQQQKMDHILKKLNIESGDRMLDIGCGWGGLAIKAAENYDIDVLGITLSEEQVKGAGEKIKQKGLSDKVKIIKKDYRKLAEEGEQFDKIVSVGMFEHVGQEYIEEYFSAVKTMLKKGGLSLLHSITHLTENPTHPWIQKYIFPWGYIPSLREIVWHLGEQSFHLIDAENIGFHYALTLEKWLENYEQITDRVREKFDDEFVRMWELFLMGSIAAFRYADTSVHQLLFSNGKNIDLPLTRDYMYN
ncbi:MAG: class I SAM-dependent methyltransferase [Bacillota bacterium]